MYPLIRDLNFPLGSSFIVLYQYSVPFSHDYYKKDLTTILDNIYNYAFLIHFENLIIWNCNYWCALGEGPFEKDGATTTIKHFPEARAGSHAKSPNNRAFYPD